MMVWSRLTIGFAFFQTSWFCFSLWVGCFVWTSIIDGAGICFEWKPATSFQPEIIEVALLPSYLLKENVPSRLKFNLIFKKSFSIFFYSTATFSEKNRFLGGASGSSLCHSFGFLKKLLYMFSISRVRWQKLGPSSMLLHAGIHCIESTNTGLQKCHGDFPVDSKEFLGTWNDGVLVQVIWTNYLKKVMK